MAPAVQCIRQSKMYLKSNNYAWKLLGEILFILPMRNINETDAHWSNKNTKGNSNNFGRLFSKHLCIALRTRLLIYRTYALPRCIASLWLSKSIIHKQVQIRPARQLLRTQFPPLCNKESKRRRSGREIKFAYLKIVQSLKKLEIWCHGHVIGRARNDEHVN